VGCLIKALDRFGKVIVVLIAVVLWGLANACIWGWILAAMREGGTREEVLYRQLCGWYIGIISTILLTWVVIVPFLPQPEVSKQRHRRIPYDNT
jgi:ABC-type amino acid transport system permease subunit